MKKNWIFIFALSVLAAAACWYYFFYKPIRPAEPVRSVLDSSLVLPLSTIRIPIEFKIKDLEKLVNEKLSGSFIREWIAIGDKNKDSIYLELQRIDSIRLTWRAGQLSARVPLRVLFHFKKEILGVRLQNEKPIVAEVILHLRSFINLDKNWRIRPSTSISNIEWLKDPSVKIIFLHINLRKFAETYIEKDQGKFTSQFDGMATDVLDTRNLVSKVWQDIQQPIVINKANPRMGLLAQAETLMWRWNPSVHGNISGMITLKAKVYAWFDEPMEHEIAPLPPYRYAERAAETLDLYVLAKLPYERLNVFAWQHLEKISYTYKSHTIRFRNAEFFGSEQELAMKVQVNGAVNGKIYLKAQPYFDSRDQVIGLRNLHYDLNTEEVLLSTADWMVHDQLISILSDTVRKDIREELNGLPKLIEQGIARSNSGQKIMLSVDSLTLSSYASLITGKDIQWILRARGSASIELDKRILDGKSGKN